MVPKILTNSLLRISLAAAEALLFHQVAVSQEVKAPKEISAASDEHIALRSNDLTLDILKSSGFPASLRPAADRNFDFTPGDRMAQRSADTFYHLGDVDIRIRSGSTIPWRAMSSAYKRRPVKILEVSSTRILADITQSLPADAGVSLTRSWVLKDGELQLVFQLKNMSSERIELGGLGIGLVFNNLLDGRTLDEVHQRCSFYDPYIGMQAGYVQVVPLNGTGPVLLVAPLDQSPLEAWKPILSEKDSLTGLGKIENDPTPRSVTFEGSFDWMIHSKAFADQEWKGAKQWNSSSSEFLQPGQARTFGLRFFVAPSVRAIEPTLFTHGRPVVAGVPGYILPEDVNARLFVKYKSPVLTVVAEPLDSFDVKDDGLLASGNHAYTLHGKQWGDAKLLITYADGTVQPVPYRIIRSERQAIESLGRFLTTRQWYTNLSDPFGRAPSILSYDNQAKQLVLQDKRAWIAGLSDEAGAGPFLAAAMKEYVAPKPEEVAKLDEFVDSVLWGHLQVKDGPHQYGIRKSLFYLDPVSMPAYPYKEGLHQGTTWDKAEAYRLDRTYNYPHVVSTYWALYHVARNTTIKTRHPWLWYLDQAYRTTMAMQSEASLFDRYGLMEGTIFTVLLDDLRAEGQLKEAANLETYMRHRVDVWEKEAFPFGSEMPWDSTGQEEVYAWAKRFSLPDKADVTLNAILAYTPTIPSWGYNGSARRYWDFGTAGKSDRLERMLHHYGSGLNSLPLLAEFRDHPDDLYLLRVGYAATMGPLSNINEDGFASLAFHSFPDSMSFDPYSGDYGSNFFGHAMGTGVYITHDQDLGWLCFGGNLREQEGHLIIDVRDSARRRIFVAPFKLFLTADAGRIQAVDIDLKRQAVRIQFSPRSPTESRARFTLTGTTGAGKWHVSGVPLSGNHYSVALKRIALNVPIQK